MAVMQTPHGRVIGLILPKEDQPMKEAVEEKPKAEATPSVCASAATSLGEGGKGKAVPVKKTGRPARK